MKIMTYLKRPGLKRHSTKPQYPSLLSRSGASLAICLLASQGVLAPAMAQSIERSWFEIELLAFSRDNNQRLLEQFPAKVRVIATQGSEDLLSPLYRPDLTAILLASPSCSQQRLDLNVDPALTLDSKMVTAPLFATDEASLAATQFAQTKSALPAANSFELPAVCPFDTVKINPSALDTTLPGALQISQIPPAQLPLTPPGQEQHQPTPYLAPASALQLKDLAYQLKHRAGHQLLLHTAWRQPLAGKRQSRSYRWFGGSNFGQQFDYFGRAKVSAIEPAAESRGQLLQQITALEQAFAQNPAAPLAELQPALNQHNDLPVWQLDGLIKVYSERMLFAETDFNLRRLSADGSKLSTYHSSDQTRLLIGEVHYLDHPHLGLVLQIRRFTPPLLPVAPLSQ